MFTSLVIQRCTLKNKNIMEYSLKNGQLLKALIPKVQIYDLDSKQLLTSRSSSKSVILSSLRSISTPATAWLLQAVTTGTVA